MCHRTILGINEVFSARAMLSVFYIVFCFFGTATANGIFTICRSISGIQNAHRVIRHKTHLLLNRLLTASFSFIAKTLQQGSKIKWFSCSRCFAIYARGNEDELCYDINMLQSKKFYLLFCSLEMKWFARVCFIHSSIYSAKPLKIFTPKEKGIVPFSITSLNAQLYTTQSYLQTIQVFYPLCQY